ncbi:asparaginase [Blastocystis sp. subtype 4]|uniref:asparaginase n=1 Tax=Blastocystis sp. subtype 4 TaxID=944170 RepID=UPI000711E75B|nr:asparaginase [Blastocystis sp. subtype 4]KNB46004.1 asparaginase [Blastocystis sp. subtype 4]|eukprot:XP_014529447.1 asparaginase [Blastocystis sp. subtype 4]
MKRNPDLPNVVILGTGGTIAGKGKSSTNTAVYEAGAMDISDLVSGTPEILTAANCVAKGVLQKPSENMKVHDWIVLAENAQKYLDCDDVDGVVVTHGTDTLEESCYFCHLVLHSQKPVVFTGAMRPATALSADGGLNLLNAVVAAGSPATRGLGSLVVMNEELYSARDVTKINTFKVNSFGSADLGPLGFIQEQQIYLYHLPYRRHTENCEFDLKVDILYVYPNLDLDILKYYLDKNDGLVIAASGNGSISDDVMPILAENKHKCVIVRGSRCSSGIVTPNPSADKTLNLISSGNLSPQKARVLLMMALTVTKDVSEIQDLFNRY